MNNRLIYSHKRRKFRVT